MRGRICILIAGSSAQPPRATPNPTPTSTNPAKAEVTPTRPKTPLTTKQASIWAASSVFAARSVVRHLLLFGQCRGGQYKHSHQQRGHRCNQIPSHRSAFRQTAGTICTLGHRTYQRSFQTALAAQSYGLEVVAGEGGGIVGHVGPSFLDGSAGPRDASTVAGVINVHDGCDDF